MLDIKFIRENKDIVQAGAKKKRVEIDIEKLIALDDERLKELKEVEDLRSRSEQSFQRHRAIPRSGIEGATD